MTRLSTSKTFFSPLCLYPLPSHSVCFPHSLSISLSLFSFSFYFFVLSLTENKSQKKKNFFYSQWKIGKKKKKKLNFIPIWNEIDQVWNRNEILFGIVRYFLRTFWRPHFLFTIEIYSWSYLLYPWFLFPKIFLLRLSSPLSFHSLFPPLFPSSSSSFSSSPANSFPLKPLIFLSVHSDTWKFCHFFSPLYFFSTPPSLFFSHLFFPFSFSFFLFFILKEEINSFKWPEKKRIKKGFITNFFQSLFTNWFSSFSFWAILKEIKIFQYNFQPNNYFLLEPGTESKLPFQKPPKLDLLKSNLIIIIIVQMIIIMITFVNLHAIKTKLSLFKIK